MKMFPAVLLLLAICTFGLCDMFTTALCYVHLGTFDAESSGFLRLAYDAGGFPAVLILKLGLSTLAFVLAYVLMLERPDFSFTGSAILGGSAVSGIYVSLSNLNVVYNGSSFWLFGIDSGKVGAVLIIIPCIVGISIDALKHLKKREAVAVS